MAKRPPNTRPFLRRIYEALTQHPTADGIRISIESTASDLPMEDGTIYHAKSLCWSLLAGEEEVSEPVLAVVHADLTEDVIRSDLAVYFEGYSCVLDNEIHIADD